MNAVTFTTIHAVESIEARAEVEEFALELHESDLRSWEKSCDQARALGKPLPQKSRHAFDLAHCRAESKRIRTKRERTSTYWNDFIDPYA